METPSEGSQGPPPRFLDPNRPPPLFIRRLWRLFDLLRLPVRRHRAKMLFNYQIVLIRNINGKHPLRNIFIFDTI